MGVLVVGSLHHDVMVDAPRRPGPGETVAGFAWRPKFGGKGGNQAVAAARAGASARMLGAVGDDGFGAFLREALRAGGVDDRFVATIRGGSGLSVAISDPSGEYGAVIVPGANALIEPAALDDPAPWEGARVLLLQNEVPEALNLAAARAGRNRGLRVCLNAAPARPLLPDLAACLDLLVVNAVEAEALAGPPVASLDEAQRAAATLAERVPAAIVTAGAAGVAAAERGGGPWGLPAEPVRVASTHGAGDAFVGTLAAALDGGASLVDAVRRGSRAAARHVAGTG